MWGLIMYSDKDVIVAAATSQQVKAPLSVIRVSGEGCWAILKDGFRSRFNSSLKPWQMRYGDWLDEDGVVDDVMVVVYRGPKSYTGQDMFELTAHGNPVLVEAIVRDVVRRGARRARPGEFTMRAVLNGKMGLLEAEGVSALIESNTRYQADLARRQAKGPLVGRVREYVEEILQIQAHIEATIDYGEEDVDALERDSLVRRIGVLVDSVAKVRDTGLFARGMRRGFRVLITGEPNVGKSTLFNTLVKNERAIVTHLPGTTRDLISEEIEIDGLPVVLVDSAGVRDTDDVVESLGIEKIFEMLEDVDLVLYLAVNGDQKPPYDKILELPKEKWITIGTKLDVSVSAVDGFDVVLSAVTGEGVEELEKEVVNRLTDVMKGQSVYLINERQSDVMEAVTVCLQQAWSDFKDGFGEEVLSSYLNTARSLLGELTGETTVEDILDRMFSNFCLGK